MTFDYKIYIIISCISVYVVINLNNGKLRLIALADFFKSRTDEEHIYSATEIVEELEKQGISCERKALYSDIDALKDAGYDIVCTRSPKTGFFLASRDFEDAEIRLMIDAVQAAKFITAKKTDALVNKIGSLLSEPQAKKLKSQVYTDTSRKSKNEEIYYTIDTLHNAISKKKKVSFVYSNLSVTDDLTPSFNEREFTVSPYALIWSNDHYYLVCNNSNYDNLMHTRVDRMSKVVCTDEHWRHFSEVSDYKDKFDSADYAGKLFNMFSGVEQRVTLRCANRFLEEIIDRFGDNIRFTSRNADNFTAKVDAVTGEGFISWVLQYGGAVEVIQPAQLRATLAKRAAEIARIYSGEEGSERIQ